MESTEAGENSVKDRVRNDPGSEAQQRVRTLRPGPNRQTFEEAMAATFAQYDGTLRVLAGLQDTPEEPTPTDDR